MKDVTERGKATLGHRRIQEQETKKEDADTTTPRVNMNNLKSLYVKNNLQRLMTASNKTLQERIIRFRANGDHNQEQHTWKPAYYELRKPNPSVRFTSVNRVIQENTRSTPEIMKEPSAMTKTEIEASSRNSNIGLNEQGNNDLHRTGLLNGRRNGNLKAKPDAIEKPRLQVKPNEAMQSPTVFTPQTQKKIEQVKEDITAIANEEYHDYTDIGREDSDHDGNIERLEQHIDDMMMMERRFEDLGESEDLVDDMELGDKVEIEDKNTKIEHKRLTKHVRPKRAIPDVFEDSVGLINSLPLIDLELMVPGQTEETPTSTQGLEETMSDADNGNEKGEEFRTVITFEEKSGPKNDGNNRDEVTQTTRITQETTSPTIFESNMDNLIKTSGDTEGQIGASTSKSNTEEIETTNTTTMKLNNEEITTITVTNTDEKPSGELTEQKDSQETIAKEHEIIVLRSQLNTTEIDFEHLRELRTDRSDTKNSEAEFETSTSLFHIEKEGVTEFLISNMEKNSTTTKDTPANIEETTAFSRSEKDDVSETTTVQPTTLQHTTLETTTSVTEISTKMSVSVKVSVSVSEKIEKVDMKKIVDNVDDMKQFSLQETSAVKEQSDTTVDVLNKTTESMEGSTSKTTEPNKATVPTLDYDITSTSTEAIETRQNKNDDGDDHKTVVTHENSIQEGQVETNGTKELNLKPEDRNLTNKLNDGQFKATELTVEENDKPQSSEYDQENEGRKEDPDSKTTEVIIETSSSLFKTEKDISTQRYHEDVEITTIGVVTKRDILDTTEVTTTENMLKDSLSNGTSEINLESQKSLNETTGNKNGTMIDEGKQDKESDQVRNEKNDNENYLATKETSLVSETESTTGINNLQETMIGDVNTTKGTDIAMVLEEKESNLNVPKLTTTEAIVEIGSYKMENTTVESSDNTTRGELSTVVTDMSPIDKNINESEKLEGNSEKHNITTDHTMTQEDGDIKNEKQQIEINSSNEENISENIMNHNESNLETSSQMSDKSFNNETSNNTTSQADIGLEQKPLISSEIFKNTLPNIEETKESQKNKNINKFKLRQRPTYQRPMFRKNQESQTGFKQHDNSSTNGTHEKDETHAHKDMINSRRIIVDKMNADIVQTLVNDKHRFNVRTRNKINQQKHEQSELLKEKFGIKPVLGLKTKSKTKTDEESQYETAEKMTEENNSNSGVEEENEENQETVQENSETLTNPNEYETDENGQDNAESLKERLTKLRQEKIKNRYLTTVQKHRQNERIQISKSDEIKNRINAMIDRQNADELGSSRSKFTNLQRLDESNGGRIKYTPIRTVKTDIKIPIDKLWTEESNSNYERNPQMTNTNERIANSFRPTTSRTFIRKLTTQSLYSSLMAEKKPQPRVPFRPSSASLRRTSEKPDQFELENSDNRRVDEERPENEPEENPSAPSAGAFDRPLVSTSKYHTKPFNRNVQNSPFETKHIRPSLTHSQETTEKPAQFELENSDIEEYQSGNEQEENSNPSAINSGALDKPNTPTIKIQRNQLNRNVQNIPQIKPTIRISTNRFSNFKKVSPLEKLEKEPNPKPEVKIELKNIKSTESRVQMEDLNEQNIEATSSQVETLDYDSATPNSFIDSIERNPEPQQNLIVRNEVNESSKLKNNDRSTTSYLKRGNNQRNILGHNLNPRLLKLLSHEKSSR
uniref:Uncharacterized protein n=1 Tax=Cacopsylla melanoneura TaxID=428564 RepID=A0A8D9F2L3_9HEMI